MTESDVAIVRSEAADESTTVALSPPSGSRSPAAPLRTPGADYGLHVTMSSIGHYLDGLVTSSPLAWANAKHATELQKLVSNAHMAVMSQQYDTSAIWTELFALKARAETAIMSFQDGIMHPRVLTALLRLIVEGDTASEIERQALAAVRMMVAVACEALPVRHPLRLLLGMTPAKATDSDVLKGFMKQYQSRLLNRISDNAPDFAVREQIYGARVLASLGQTADADSVLQRCTDLHDRINLSTVADWHRTAGYSKIQAGKPTEGRPHLESALTLFETSGQQCSDNAMYNRLSLATLCRQEEDLSQAAVHMKAVLHIWEANRKAGGGQGGLKFVRDLHSIYEKLGDVWKTVELELKYPEYFEEQILRI
jgi:hypothetical protein